MPLFCFISIPRVSIQSPTDDIVFDLRAIVELSLFE